jgi:hypothetical protein
MCMKVVAMKEEEISITISRKEIRIPIIKEN